MQISPPAPSPPAVSAAVPEPSDAAAGPAALDGLQLESLAINLDAALRVHRRTQFFGWTQGLLQGLVRHEVLICALRGADARALRVDSFSTAAADPARISELFLHDASFAPHLVRAWEERRFRPLVCDLAGGPLAGGPLGRELERLGATRLVAHGTHDASGRTASLFTFACRPRRESPGDAYLVQLAVPFLHAAWLRTQVGGAAEEGAGAAPAAAATLTPREQQIMKWICLGKSNSEIGAILEISPLTVKNHVQKILRRLNVANRAQAVAKALELRILGP
jgi:transcriptional regulator EpsA